MAAHPYWTQERMVHVLRVANTIRRVAIWRGRQADQYPAHQRENVRAKLALRHLANFVEALPLDDKDLAYVFARCDVSPDGRSYTLDPESFGLLSRFGLVYSSWQHGVPGEAQMRNVLRRAEGQEQMARANARRDAS